MAARFSTRNSVALLFSVLVVTGLVLSAFLGQPTVPSMSPGVRVGYGPSAARYHPIAVTRIASGLAVSAGTDKDVTVTGVAGIPSDATAVLVNVEVHHPSTAGYLRVTPKGSPTQTAVQEFVAGQSISALASVKVGTSGKITLHLSAGSATVYIDAQGFFGAPSDSTGDFFTAVTTNRIGSGIVVSQGTDANLTVTGVGGVPSGADAVVLNVEVYQPSATGYFRVTPKGSPSQTAVQEFVAAQTISNLATVKVGTGGQVTLHISAGSAKFYVDVAGYYSTSGTTLYQPMAVSRIASGLLVKAGSDANLVVTGQGGIPSTGVTAVVINVEIFSPTAAGYLRVTATGSPSQTAVQEFSAGRAISNLVTVKVGSGGMVTLHVSAGQARIYVDAEGYFS